MADLHNQETDALTGPLIHVLTYESGYQGDGYITYIAAADFPTWGNTQTAQDLHTYRPIKPHTELHLSAPPARTENQAQSLV